MIPNLAWCAILVALLAGATIGVRAFARPVFVLTLWHNLIWAGALVLIATNLIRYKQASLLAWVTLTTGLLAFNVGAASISALLARRRSRTSVTTPGRFGIAPSHLTTRPLFYGALAVYAIAVLGYLATIQLRFGLVTFLTHPTVIRKGSGGVSYLESVPLPVRLLLYLGPVLFAILLYGPGLDRPFRPVTRSVGAIALALSMLALLQRSNLFISILLVCALYICRPQTERAPAPKRNGFFGRIRSRWDNAPQPVRLIGGLAVLGVIALAAFQGIGGALGKTGQQALHSGAESDALAQSGLTSPFQYYTAGTMAFLRLVDTTEVTRDPQTPPSSQTWGADTFSLLLKPIPRVPHVDPISTFIDTGVKTNVYTWFEPYYRDFRLGGVLVGSLAYGALLGWLFVRRNRSQTTYWIQAAAFSTVFLAPFASRLNSALVVSMIVYIAILSLAARWLATRRREHSEEEQLESA